MYFSSFSGRNWSCSLWWLFLFHFSSWRFFFKFLRLWISWFCRRGCLHLLLLDCWGLNFLFSLFFCRWLFCLWWSRFNFFFFGDWSFLLLLHFWYRLLLFFLNLLLMRDWFLSHRRFLLFWCTTHSCSAHGLPFFGQSLLTEARSLKHRDILSLLCCLNSLEASLRNCWVIWPHTG